MKRWRLLPAAFVGLLTLAGTAFAQDSDQTRFYLGLRLGAQLFPDSQIANGIEATKLDFPAYGASVGVDFGRYFGLELAADTFEPSLRTASLGTLGDWSVWTLVPQARLRYPLLDGRLTPYVIAGVGVGFAEFNDRKPRAAGVHIQAKDTSLVGAIGAGLEYFVANNIAAGIEARYLALRDQRVEVADLTRQTHPDSLLLTFGLPLCANDSETVTSPGITVGGRRKVSQPWRARRRRVPLGGRPQPARRSCLMLRVPEP